MRIDYIYIYNIKLVRDANDESVFLCSRIKPCGQKFELFNSDAIYYYNS